MKERRLVSKEDGEAGLTEESAGLTAQVRDRIGIVTLARPPINALDGRLLEALSDTLERWRDDACVSAVVITGGLRNAFCAGGDLDQLFSVPMAELGRIRRRRLFSRFQECFRLIENYAKPTVAAVNGIAIGAGVELALVCDLRIASELAFFSLPELAHGFIPGLGATQRLWRFVGLGRAKELMLLGGRLRAPQALQWGLIDRMVPRAEVIGTALSLAKKLGELDREAFGALKRCILAGFERTMDECLAFETRTFSALIDRAIARRVARGNGALG